MKLNSSQQITFSIDLEEWWSVESFSKLGLGIEQSAEYDRISVGVKRILLLLEKYSATATFFVLGRVALKYPEIILLISEKGHEIGTHGFAHKLIYQQTPIEFENDLVRSIKILEKILGRAINSYRAPSYSITKNSLWALEILAKNGIKYDSSIVPTSNSRFGIRNAPSYPYKILLSESNSELIEFPPTVIKIMGKFLPVSSGFAFRLFPTWIIKNLFIKLIQSGSLPMIIMHNWEVDNDHPRVKAGLKGQLIHYHNINKAETKLEFFLQNFSLVPLPKDINGLETLTISDLS